MDRLDFMENNSRVVECKTHRCGGFSTGEHIIILFNYAERVLSFKVACSKFLSVVSGITVFFWSFKCHDWENY